MNYSDKELAEMSVGGDSEAFSKLLDRYLQPVYSFALKITSNKDDAEDVVQEAFFKAWRNLKKYNTSYSFKNWIFTITHNCSIDLLRKRKNFVFSDFEMEGGVNPVEDNLVDTEKLPDEVAMLAQDISSLEWALKSINPIQREVLELYYKEDMTFEEVGKILSKPLNTVKSLHRRALLKLKEVMLHQNST